MTYVKPLNIVRLRKGHPGLTAGSGLVLLEACSVCLERAGHVSPATLNIRGSVDNGQRRLRFLSITQQMRNTFADQQELTENAAVGLAIAFITMETAFTVIERAMKTTGIDYWLGKKEESGPLFQKKARLEVSGILSGDDKTITKRVKQKQKQAEQSKASGLPVFVAIGEFSQPILVVEFNECD